MTTPKIRYSLLNYFLVLLCCVLIVLLWVVQADHRRLQQQAEQEIQLLEKELEQKQREELQLKLFTLKQMSRVLSNPSELPLYSTMAGEMAVELAPHYRDDTYIWWVLMTTKVLVDGFPLEEAKKLLGEPKKFTTAPAYGKPPYYEWHSGKEKLSADLVDGKFQFWRLGHVDAIGGY